MTVSAVADPEISVVVCVYNDPIRIGATLAGLRDQRSAPPFEVIVVDDGSTQDPADAVMGIVSTDERFSFIVHPENKGLAPARNTGLAAARGRIVAFTDSDCRPGPDWVASIMEAWERAPEGTKALAGLVVAADEDSVARRYISAMEVLRPLEIELKEGASMSDRVRTYLSLVPDRTEPRAVASPVGANMAFDKDALNEIGGFDPSIRFGGEEVLASRDLTDRFGQTSIWFDPSCTMSHDFDPGFRDSFRRAKGYGRGAGKAFGERGGHPEIRPVATVVALLFAWAVLSRSRRSIRTFVIAALAVPAIVWRKTFRQFHRFGPEVAVYPSVALTEEIFTMIGFIQGWRQSRGTIPARR